MTLEMSKDAKEQGGRVLSMGWKLSAFEWMLPVRGSTWKDGSNGAVNLLFDGLSGMSFSSFCCIELEPTRVRAARTAERPVKP